ncbi:hypothetical protein [Haloferax sp. Atlit-12N]|uniref:hypothetical protein n=1 Tax=Haloferax sp. Atlit-12N TaxID=2077203 RepID=UPI0018F3A1A8|nr:hypothetical protein [Haloferax sp. Atlit-12N]
MSAKPPLVCDGSAVKDAGPLVRIDRSQFTDRMRYVCPNGHASWAPTNSHIWCRSCSRASANDDDVDPEHYAVRDKKTGELINYSRVELVE